MSYSLDAMIAKFRREMDDTIEPYLWSDLEIVDFFDEAEDEFTSVVDVLTGEITVNVAAGQKMVNYPTYITRLRRAENSLGRTIELYNTEQWQNAMFSDDYGSATLNTTWRTTTGQNVKALITDMAYRSLRAYPIVEADEDIILHVYRRPKEPLADRGEFEVQDREHQRCMLLKARSLAYAKHDSETHNAQLAYDYEAMYNRRASELQSENLRVKRRAGAVRYPSM